MIPALTSECCENGRLRWTLKVPAATPFFGGHFPDRPILPGVVALSWMMAAAARLQGGSPATVSLANVKFQVVIEPGAVLELTVDKKTDTHLLGTIRSEAGIHATALIPACEA